MLLRSAFGRRHRFDPHRLFSPAAAKTHFNRHYFTLPESSADGRTEFFRHYLIHLAGLAPPVSASGIAGISVQDTKKLLRLVQVEKLKTTLREIEEAAIPYAEFVSICAQGCGNEDQGAQFAKTLDDSGNVIVLGSVVLLRPEQVAKRVEGIMTETTALLPENRRRRRELEEMEKEKAKIDEKARAQVRREMYSGLGLMGLQTVGLIRLTFWELSWDVMEPICFFVSSFYFIGAYAFFLRTSKEPSFEGYFQRRFKTKQNRLIKAHSFDLDKYNKLHSKGKLAT